MEQPVRTRAALFIAQNGTQNAAAFAQGRGSTGLAVLAKLLLCLGGGEWLPALLKAATGRLAA